MSDPTLTPSGLELIRDLAACDTNIASIRAALHSQSGTWFRDHVIIAAGRMFGVEIRPMSPTPVERVSPVVLLAGPVGRVPDRVRLVEPGTHRVPVGGFSMLSRRDG